MSESGYRPGPTGPRVDYRYHVNIALYLLLTIITVGLFNLYWNWKQMQACNDLLEREEFSFLTWLLLNLN